MLLSITNTAPRATDLGYLLHKSPSRLHRFELAFGRRTCSILKRGPIVAPAPLLEIGPLRP